MGMPNGLFSRIWDAPYGKTNSFQFFDAAKNSREFVQKLQLQIKIPAHTGCVNSICWNENGRFLLSGSDDQRLSVVHGHNYSVLAVIPTGHRANIFSAKFMPNTDDTKVVSCSGDGIIIFSHLGRSETSLNNKFNCHRGTAYEIITVPNDANTFLSCGEDRTVRWFDVRTKQCCLKDNCKDDVLINCRSPVTSLAVNPLSPYQLAVGCGDASVRIYDRRMLSTQTAGTNNSFRALMTCFTVPEFTQTRRITSLCYSSDGQEMLVSYSSDYIYLFDVRDNLDKKPKILSRNSSDGSDSDSGALLGRPLVKRLRVRGDWSDTGPNARPEAESRGEQPDSSHEFSLVRRMTDILTRMFYDSSRNRSRSEVSQSSSESSHPFSRSESDEGTNDNEHDIQRATDVQSNSQAARGSEPLGEAGSSSDASKNSKDFKEHETENEGLNLAEESGTNVADKKQEIDFLKCKNRTEKATSTKAETQSNADNKGKRRLCVGNKVEAKVDSENKRKREQDTINNDKISDDNNVVCDTSATITDTLPKHTTVVSSLEAEPSTSKSVPDRDHVENEEFIPSQHEEDISESVNLDFKNIEKKLESRRKDLIEKHHTEPMMNLHYSGEGVNSGIITMDVASSSTPNERQWLEQSASDLPDLPSDLSLPTSAPSQLQPSENSEPTRDQQSSSESETDIVLDSVQPNSDFNRIVSVTSTANTTTLFGNSPRVRTTVENPGREIEFRMEVDSWDTDGDSEDDTRTRAARRTRHDRRPSIDSRLPFLSSLEDQIQTRSEDSNKDELQFDDVTQPRVKRKYTGHRNARTMIKESTFWGDNFIMSGSDCGHIFVWDRETTELVMLMEADHHVVNCLQPHPFDPILASSGIDYDIKIWAPLREEPFFDREKAVEIIQRNEVMLEETKDTITVPASFMFRMLVSLSDYRASRIRTRESIQRLRRFVSGDESRT